MDVPIQLYRNIRLPGAGDFRGMCAGVNQLDNPIPWHVMLQHMPVLATGMKHGTPLGA